MCIIKRPIYEIYSWIPIQMTSLAGNLYPTSIHIVFVKQCDAFLSRVFKKKRITPPPLEIYNYITKIP
jgi:hypothetical protein